MTAYSQELELTKKINDLVDYYIIEAEKTGKTGTEKSQQVIEKVSAEISSFVSCEKIQRVIEQKINQINFFAKPKAK